MRSLLFVSVLVLATTASGAVTSGTPTEQNPAVENETLSKAPKIAWVDENGIRRETGGAEGCFGTDGNAILAALPPDVIAVTYSEYGCKGQPISAVCGQGVAERIKMPMAAPAGQDIAATEIIAGQDISRFDAKPVPRFQTAPKLGTVGCTYPEAAIRYAKGAREQLALSDPQRLALEQYSGMMSVRMPQAVPLKSVYLTRVGPSAESTCPLMVPGEVAPTVIGVSPTTQQPAQLPIVSQQPGGTAEVAPTTPAASASPMSPLTSGPPQQGSTIPEEEAA